MKPFFAPMKCSTSITVRLAAMAPRVANTTDSTVAAAPAPAPRSRRTPPRSPSRACGRRSCDGRRGLRGGTSSASSRRNCARSGVGVGCEPHDHDARHRQVVELEPGAEPGLQQPRRFVARIGPHVGDAGKPRAISAARATSASISRPAAPRTWIVTSRATSDCQSPAAERTSITAPVVSDARNVMIAMTAISARPAIVLSGTIGFS